MKNYYNVVLLSALCVLFCSFENIGFSQSCTHTINLTDTYGDGWNNGAVSVSVNGVNVLTNITITLAQGGLTPISFNFFASSGENIRVYRTAAGSYPSEMRVQIVANNTVLLNTVEPVAGTASSGGYTCVGYCSTAGVGCVNSAAYGSSSAPSICNNSITFGCTLQDEYNTIANVIAGDIYTVNSTCGGYVTVRYGSYNGSVVSAGFVPLTWNATNSGSYYIHWNTNANCGTATNCCNTTITKICAPSSPISISPNVTTTCTVQSATLTVNGNVGTTYWFLSSCGNSIATSIGSGNSIVVSPAVTSTYYARNYNGQWSSNCASATVTVSTPPAQPLNPTSNFTPCSPVTITRSGNPPAGETWYWQGTNPNGTSVNSGSGPTYTANSSGTYYLRAINSSGCWSSQSASIYVAVDLTPNTPASPISNSPQCGSVSLNRVGNPSAGETWYWQGTNPNGTVVNLGSGPTYNANSSGIYYLRAMNSSGCWSTNCSAISVIVHNSSASWQNIQTCDSYTWINGVTYTSSTNGNQFSVPGGTVNGCDSVIMLNLNLYNSYDITQNVAACQNFTWIDGVNYQSSTNTPVIALTSVSGCDSTVHLNLIISYPQFDTTLVNATSLFSYSLNGIEYTQSGEYYQLLQDQYGCDSLVQLNLIIEPAGISDHDLDVRVYPNPSIDGIFYIQTPYNNITFDVYDAFGNIIRIVETAGQLSLAHLSKGIYFIRYVSEQAQGQIKLEYP